MKKCLKTVLILLVVLVIALGIFAYFNCSIISAFLMAYTTSEDELRDKVDSSGDIIDNDMLSGYTDIALRDLTEDEKSKLANNEISEEDAVALVMGMLDSESLQTDTENTEIPEHTEQQDESEIDTSVTEAPANDTSVQDIPEEKFQPESVETDIVPDEKEEPIPSIELPDKAEMPVQNAEYADSEKPLENNTEQSDELQQVNKKVAELVAKIYVVKARVVSKLDTYIEELRVEYLANKPTREERVATKPQFAARAIKVVAKWEKECDVEINKLLSEMESLLKDSGQSAELVNTIKKAYEDEKSAKKAYCINRYLD